MAKKPYTEEYNPLVGHVRTKFQQAETSRLYDEKRWLKAYRNYRGMYGPEMAFRDNEKSKVFVKITKTKVLASFGQIIEVLFGAHKFPIGIEPTPIPEETSEYAHLKQPGQQSLDQPQEQEELLSSPYGFPGDGKTLPPGATADSLIKDVAQEYRALGFDEGPAPDLKSMPQIEPARLAAEKMEKVLQDQLEETDAIKSLKSSTVAFYIYLQPLLATILAIILGKDILTQTKIIAAVFIFIGVYFVVKRSTT